MIRDGAPPSWSPLMRLVASEIADDAGDPGTHPLQDGGLPWSAIPVEGEFRHGKWRDGLAERCGMSTRAISRVLADLAAAGYEMRQPITGRDGKPVTDKRGRLIFAANGHALRFVVPPLLPREQPQRSPDLAGFDPGRSPQVASFPGQRSPESAPFSQGRSPEVASFDPGRSPNLATPSPQGFSPQENQSPQPPHLAAPGTGEGRPATAGERDKIDSEEKGNRQCGYAQCRIRIPVPAGRDMHEVCERFAALKAQSARSASPAVPVEREHPVAS